MKKSNFLLVFIFLLSLIAYSHTRVSATWTIDENGNLLYLSSNVLGDDDESDSSGSGSSGSSDSPDESDEPDETDSPDESDEPEETDSPDESDEPESSEGPGSGSDSSDDGFEYEYESEVGGVKTKIKLRSEDGRLKIEQESEDGDLEIDDDLLEIRENKNKTTIKVSTASGNRLVFVRGKSAATTSFPLSVDSETNELIVTTPSGVKRVAVLPDQVIANLLSQNVIDSVDEPDHETDDSIGEIDEEIDLEEVDGELVYEVDGESSQKALGLIDVKIKRKVTVSAQTGELLDIESSFLQRLLDLISF